MKKIKCKQKKTLREIEPELNDDVMSGRDINLKRESTQVCACV